MSGRSTNKRRSQNAPAPADGAQFPWIAADLRPLAEPLEMLVPNEKNARQHSEANMAAVAASLRQFGQRKPIVVNRRGGVIEAGNAVYEAARSIGWTHLAVVWVEDDPSAAAGFALADNRTAELAAWNETVLAELISDLDYFARNAPRETPSSGRTGFRTIRNIIRRFAQILAARRFKLP